MGRIQSSIGLITGTDIVGTVDQLIAISARPRDRLLARTETLQKEQQAIAELTASVIGVQLAGNQLGTASLFRSKKAESSNSEAVSVEAGNAAVAGTHQVRTLQTAATHSIGSLQRFSALDQPLGYEGEIRLQPAGGFIDGAASLASLNGGRGVEPGVIRITDRSGRAAEIDLTSARDINEVIDQINAASIDVRATTLGDSIQLIDQSGSTLSNLKVEQVGPGETAADLGLWGINVAGSVVTGADLQPTSGVLRGVSLSELNGGSGLGPLSTVSITLSDGSSAAVDLSGATTTGEIIDAIAASGLNLIVGLNDARNGFRIRDVSGGAGSLTISSSDGTASAIGLEGTTAGDILVGQNLNRKVVSEATLLSTLNQGIGINGGSFTIRDSAGALGAVNLTVQGIKTVGELINAINDLGIGVTAQINDAGDGITVVDTAGGAAAMTIEDTGSGTAAKSLGIAGTATSQVVAGNTVSALVGTQAGVIQVEAGDTLATLAEKINESGRYGEASVQSHEDGSFSLRIRSNQAGEAGRIGINTSGFDLDFRTDVRGRDAVIAVSTDGGIERILSSADGVFEIGDAAGERITTATLLDEIASDADRGSFTITDSSGAVRAINTVVDQIQTVGDLITAINALGIGVQASINDAGTGIAVVDTASGGGQLKIEDSGNGAVASSLGIAGTATTQTVAGATVSALVGPSVESASEENSGLVLTLKQLSETPITIQVREDSEAAISATKAFVDQYNLLIEKLDSLTFFNPDTEEVGLLFGSSEALRIENGYSRLLSGRIIGAGDLRSIGQVGLSFNEDGKLDFDEDKLTSTLSSSRGDVEEFFTTAETGLADRLSKLADRIAGVGNGMLLNRGETLSSQIEFNNTRIETLNERLEKERERLLRQFYATEEAIAKIQSNQVALEQIRPVSIPTG